MEVRRCFWHLQIDGDAAALIMTDEENDRPAWGKRDPLEVEAMDEKEELEFYGADAAEWLRRWDEGRSVWSIEMGGMGPGYEQAIQVVAAEVVRHLLDKKYDLSDDAKWPEQREAIEHFGLNDSETIKKLGGITGAMWGAGCNLALQIYRQGPTKVMTDARVRDRHIQVNRKFP